MKLAPNAVDLRGYRLPTEAEWEYACRSGASTSWFFSDTAEYLDRFAVSAANSSGQVAAVGLFKPNDFGLFDMLGNAAEWCHDRYYLDPRVTARSASGASPLTIVDNEQRVVRGGCFEDISTRLRSAARGMYGPGAQTSTIGFRVARSYP
jgi:formylglycine-generating enzyme required for sulfatase activity